MRRRYEAIAEYVLRKGMNAVDKIDKKMTLGYLELLTEIQNFLLQVNYDGHHPC